MRMYGKRVIESLLFRKSRDQTDPEAQNMAVMRLAEEHGDFVNEEKGYCTWE